ncbi:hypothetical protein HYX13_02995 [Candidatus Woesearchaeota archaeon]|nr:hypothetical protein [Candidatus Woesearchaeota archaeon]
MANEEKLSLERLSLERLAQQLSPQETLRLIQQGKLQTGRRYSPEQAKKFLTALTPVVEEAASKDTTSRLQAEREGAYLLRIFNPGANMFYVTLVINGIPLFTKTPEGKLDQSLLYEDEDPLLRKIVEAGMPEDVQTYFKNTQKGKGKGKKKDKNKTHRVKEKPTFVFDPKIENFLMQCGEALVFEALENASIGEVKETISGQELESLLDVNLLRQVHSQGFQVSVQSIANYVACSRRKIRELRRIYVSDFLATEEVTQLVSKYLKTFGEKLPELLRRSPNEDLVFVDAKELYFWFAGESPKMAVQHAVDGLRATLFQLYAGKLGKDDYLRFRDATAKWLAYAKATDYVRRDKFIQEKIISLFDNTIDENGAHARARDVNFEVLSRLGKRIVEDEQQALPLYLRMTVRGLWMFNYFGRDRGAEKNPMRSAHGVDVEYVQPLVHYLDRRQTYDPLLFAAAEKLEKQELEKVLEEGLETAVGCETLGRKLYTTIPQKIRERVFTDRRKGYEGRPLVADGTHLGRILRAHVGIHRETYQQEYLQRPQSPQSTHKSRR